MKKTNTTGVGILESYKPNNRLIKSIILSNGSSYESYLFDKKHIIRHIVDEYNMRWISVSTIEKGKESEICRYNIDYVVRIDWLD